MEQYKVQPLDLMQYINTKYHEPFIHARIELEGCLDSGRLAESLDTLIRVFPLLKCRYDKKANKFAELENLTGTDLLRTADSANKAGLLTQSLDMDERMIQLTISGSALYITISHLLCDGGGFK